MTDREANLRTAAFVAERSRAGRATGAAAFLSGLIMLTLTVFADWAIPIDVPWIVHGGLCLIAVVVVAAGVESAMHERERVASERERRMERCARQRQTAILAGHEDEDVAP